MLFFYLLKKGKNYRLRIKTTRAAGERMLFLSSVLINEKKDCEKDFIGMDNIPGAGYICTVSG
jgi:hypothetical protein